MTKQKEGRFPDLVEQEPANGWTWNREALYHLPVNSIDYQAVGQGGGKEPGKEAIARGELYFLWHPTTSDTFSGYGLTLQADRKDCLAGLLMVDRPRPVEPEWLKEVENTFGEYQLVAMTATGERGIGCQMRIEPDSLSYVRRFPTEKTAAIEQALTPLLEKPPRPCFSLHWDQEQRLWASEITTPFELSPELKEVFIQTGPGCVPVETNLGVVHICHASDQDIKGFANKPVLCQWQLALMSTAPVPRLRIVILDQPQNPYKFESFLNVGREDDRRVLEKMLTQEELYLAFHGDDLSHRFTKVINQDEEQREQLYRLLDQAVDYWQKLPEEQRDFDRAKVEFQRLFPL